MLHLSEKGTTGMREKKRKILTRQRMLALAGTGAAAVGLTMAGAASPAAADDVSEFWIGYKKIAAC
jgi:methyl coenzyme M reductase subunit C-like uncharacterized protein (methanogenesis marker protein 7)